MGLFPEIGRAWMTIDSDIYIWTYEHSRVVAYFDGLSHLIVRVGLIRPKPNVFINDVKFLLVLTTPIEIIILGVTFGFLTFKDSAQPVGQHKMILYGLLLVIAGVSIVAYGIHWTVISGDPKHTVMIVGSSFFLHGFTSVLGMASE